MVTYLLKTEHTGVQMMESKLKANAARLIQSRHERELSPHRLEKMARMEVEKWRNWSQLAAGADATGLSSYI